MKKLYVCLVMAFVLLFGGSMASVSAAQQKDGNIILKQCQETMNQKSVISIEEYLSSNGESVKMMAVSVDLNTKVSFIELFGMQLYFDQINGYCYYQDVRGNKWYVKPVEDADTSTTEDAAESTETIDSTQNPVYKETKLYRDVMCDVLEVTVKNEDGNTYNATYYINETTHEICGYTVIDQTGMLEVVYSYPESVIVPSRIVKSAALEKGTVVKKSQIEYKACEKGVEVSNGRKLNGNAVIPDSITFAGKKYAVVKVSDKAFSGNKKIKKVTIGKNVKTIGKQSFYNCKKLNQIVIKSTKITKVGQKAFYGTANKMKVKAPKKQLSKYKRLINKSNTKSKITYTKG